MTAEPAADCKPWPGKHPSSSPPGMEVVAVRHLTAALAALEG